MNLRQLLKGLGRTKEGLEKRDELIRKYKSRLPYKDYKLLYYNYSRNLSPAKISMEIGIAESTFYIHKNIALAKLEVLISDYEFRELTEIAKL